MTAADIKRIRKAYNMTQDALGGALAVSSQTIYFWERGTTQPTAYHAVILHRLAEMERNAKQRKVAKQALDASRYMRPVPDEATDVSQCGIGSLLFALFGR